MTAQDIVSAMYQQYPDIDKLVNERIERDRKREDEMGAVFKAAQVFDLAEQARAALVLARDKRKSPKILSTHFQGISQTQLSKFETEVTLYKDGKPVDYTVETSVIPDEKYLVTEE